MSAPESAIEVDPVIGTGTVTETEIGIEIETATEIGATTEEIEDIERREAIEETGTIIETEDDLVPEDGVELTLIPCTSSHELTCNPIPFFFPFLLHETLHCLTHPRKQSISS